MNEVTVRTKHELDAARKSKAPTIIIEGELAHKIRKSKKIAYAGAGTIAAITAAIAATPFTGGLSMVAAAPIAAFTGFEIAAIAAVFFIGVGLLVNLFKEYDEVDIGCGKFRMVLRRKQS